MTNTLPSIAVGSMIAWSAPADDVMITGIVTDIWIAYNANGRRVPWITVDLGAGETTRICVTTAVCNKLKLEVLQ